jgi:hypothetical protein
MQIRDLTIIFTNKICKERSERTELYGEYMVIISFHQFLPVPMENICKKRNHFLRKH